MNKRPKDMRHSCLDEKLSDIFTGLFKKQKQKQKIKQKKNKKTATFLFVLSVHVNYTEYSWLKQYFHSNCNHIRVLI